MTFKGTDVVGDGIEGDDLTGAQVHQLHAGRQRLRAGQEQRVKAHLVHGLVHVARPRGLAGLVVHDPQAAVRGRVDAVDEAEQAHATGAIHWGCSIAKYPSMTARASSSHDSRSAWSAKSSPIAGVLSTTAW